MSKIYTEEQLNKLCKVYQELLRIQDWQITVRLVHQSEITDDDIAADGQFDAEHSYMKVLIRIPTAESWSPSICTTEQDMHQTLLHELVHVALNCIGPEKGSPSHPLFEAGVDRIAQVLSNLLPEPDFGEDND